MYYFFRIQTKKEDIKHIRVGHFIDSKIIYTFLVVMTTKTEHTHHMGVVQHTLLYQELHGLHPSLHSN